MYWFKIILTGFFSLGKSNSFIYHPDYWTFNQHYFFFPGLDFVFYKRKYNWESCMYYFCRLKKIVTYCWVLNELRKWRVPNKVSNIFVKRNEISTIMEDVHSLAEHSHVRLISLPKLYSVMNLQKKKVSVRRE